MLYQSLEVNFANLVQLILSRSSWLFLQGEVEQISLMKPKAQGAHDEGFLEYLEDIIGTNKYVEKIEDSLKR